MSLPIAEKLPRTFPLRHEATVVALLLVAFFVSARSSPNFLDAAYLLDTTSLFAETGLIALTMTLIIIGGGIDLSVASNMALTASFTGVLVARVGLPMGLAIVCGLLLGSLLGLFNGLLVTRLKLPPLTVTLGTFALYRGIAQILIGEHSISQFPEWFVGIDYRKIGLVPLPLIIFLIFAALFSFLLHRTVFGRETYALGSNPVASRLSGIRTDRLQIALFTLSGLMSGLGGLILTSRLSVARYDMGQGLELDAITAVVLGGTNIFGGRGTIFGTVIALALIAILRSGMGLADVKPEKQLIVIGSLLIASIVLPNLLQFLRKRKS